MNSKAIRAITKAVKKKKQTNKKLTKDGHVLGLNGCFFFLCSLSETYGGVFSLKLGSYKFVMASTPEAVKEMLVQKSVEYAGRPQTYSVKRRTLGMLLTYFNLFRKTSVLV